MGAAGSLQRMLVLALALAATHPALAAEPVPLSRSLELGVGLQVDTPGTSVTLEAGIARTLGAGWNGSAGLGFERAGSETGLHGFEDNTVYLTVGLDRPMAGAWSLQVCLTQAAAGDEGGEWAPTGETALGAGLLWARPLGVDDYFAVELLAETERLSGDEIVSVSFLLGFGL